MDTAQGKTPLTERKVVRRGLLAGLAALGAAVAMKVSGGEQVSRVEATDGQQVVIGAAQSAQAATHMYSDPEFALPIFIATNGTVMTVVKSGLAGAAEGAGAVGVHGFNATGGFGVWGESTTGVGVRGSTRNAGANYGVLGIAAPGSAGVKGVANSLNNLVADGDGDAIGVHGKSGSGLGVRGESTTGTGIQGVSATNLTGVEGISNTAGSFVNDGDGSGAGVNGRSASGQGVFGEATTGVGVRGYSNTAVGNSNGAGSGTGVEGKSGSGNGVKGVSTSAAGVRGESNSGPGVYGVSVNQPGIDGTSTNSLGIRGTSTNFVGIVGISTNNHGLYGSTNKGAGVYGIVAENLGANGPGLLITGNAPSQVFGGLQVFGGPKNAVIKMPDGSFGSLYSQESPEPFFEDFGRAQLAGGVANVPLEREFAALVAGGDYHVFTEPEGETRGLFVSRRTPAGFEVREVGGGSGSVPFSYRIVTRRKDIEGKRFARVSTEAAEKVAGVRAVLAGMGTPGASGPTGPVPPQPVVPPTNPTPPGVPGGPGASVMPPGAGPLAAKPNAAP